MIFPTVEEVNYKQKFVILDHDVLQILNFQGCIELNA